LLGSWENEERHGGTGTNGEEEDFDDEENGQKSRISPVFSMDVHSEAVWLAAGLQVRYACSLYDNLL
jgi:hypothetical protein